MVCIAVSSKLYGPYPSENMSGYQVLHQQSLWTSCVSLRSLICCACSGNPALFGAYQQLVDAWAGEAGFLHVHRLKGYNYVELALKCGRTGTTGSGEQPTGIGDGKES